MRWLALGLLLFASQAFSIDQAESIFVVAYGQYGSAHGGVPWPDRRPDIRVLGQEALCFESRYPPHCQVKGFYHDQVILLVDTLDFSNIEDTTVLLHEYIHFLQERRLGVPKDCLDGLEREQEAYRIQAAVLLKVGRPAKAREVLFMARQLRCAKE